MESTIRNVFNIFNGDKIFLVPLFQRKYVWGKEAQWNPLWEDIENLTNTRLAAKSIVPHFLGAVILKKSEGPGGTDNRIVIDGQQRFVTLHIATIALSRAIKTLLTEEELGRVIARELEEIKNTIDRQTINFGLQGDNLYKIHLYDKNFEIIKKIVDGSLNSEENSILLQCYSFFFDRFLEYLSFEINSITERANSLQSAIFDDMLICRIDLDDLEDEYEIFETINDRGSPLTVWDKAKNYIVSRSSTDSKSQEEFYRKYLADLDDLDWWYEGITEYRFKGTRIERLFSHWVRILLTKEVDENIQDRRLYYFFRNHLMTKKDLIYLLESFRIYANLYYNFETQDKDNSIQGMFCKRRETLRAAVVTPLMLKLHKTLSEEKMMDTGTRIIESYLIRRVIAGHDARAYNKVVFSLIKEIDKCQSSEIVLQRIIEYLSQRTGKSDYWPNDDKIFESILKDPIYDSISSSPRIKMVLEAIDRHITSDKAAAIPTYNELQIEHIMPQDWEKHWHASSYSSEERELALNSLGNLTLVYPSFNSSLSNKSWNDKRAEFSKHENLFINRHLLDCTLNDWDEQAIEARGKRMAEIICEIWPHADKFIEEATN